MDGPYQLPKGHPNRVMKKVTKTVGTRLTQKQHSPLIIRKFTQFGFPIFVAVIADENLDDLDSLVLKFFRQPKIQALWKSDSIQNQRNLAGMLTDHVADRFINQEAVAVVMYIDKMAVSSLRGDFMNHHQCKLELYSLLMMGTNI